MTAGVLLFPICLNNRLYRQEATLSSALRHRSQIFMEGNGVESFDPDHIHFLATVTLHKPVIRHWQILDFLPWVTPSLFTKRGLARWLQRLVKAVDMEVLSGPHVCSCSDLGNEGVTGVIVLSTSHATVHIWPEKDVPYLKMDLYSCKRFSPEVVLRMLEEFNPRICEYELIDRNHTNEDELVTGSMFRVSHRIVDYRRQKISRLSRRSPASP